MQAAPSPVGEGGGEGIKCLIDMAKPLTRRFAPTSPGGEVKRAPHKLGDKNHKLLREDDARSLALIECEP